MTTEEKELLLKDLCTRVPYGLYVQVGNEICSLREFDCEELTCGVKHSDGHFSGRDANEIKPYLRSMSSMTEAEKTIYDDLIYCDGYTKFDTSEKVIDWLNENHFDYHHLIEKGFALEAPEGMYN